MGTPIVQHPITRGDMNHKRLEKSITISSIAKTIRVRCAGESKNNYLLIPLCSADMNPSEDSELAKDNDKQNT